MPWGMYLYRALAAESFPLKIDPFLFGGSATV
jgi:hypothetical protein